MTRNGTQTAVVDDQDRLTSYDGATYQYTAHGDLQRKIVGTDTTEYTYDALGNLTRVELPNGTVIGYLLDAMNRRIGKTVNDTLVKAWLYQGQLTPVAELDGSGNVISRFVYATGVNVPDYLVRGDSTYRIIRDHLGSVRLVVNVASGTVAQRVSYDEFGIETENTNPGWQPFGYAGGLTDSQTGLVRFGARDYDPVAGRWTAKDPIRFAGGSSSLYEYALNDIVNLLDRTGTVVDVSTSPDAARVFRSLEATIHAMLNSAHASTRQDGVALHAIVHELKEHPSVVRIYYEDSRYPGNYAGTLQDVSGVGISLNPKDLRGVSDIVALMHELRHAHDTIVCNIPPDGFWGRAAKKAFGYTPRSERNGMESENRLRRFRKCTPRTEYYEVPPPCEA